MKWSVENGWHVATCDCKWLRADRDEATLRTAVAAHVKKCKTHQPKEAA